LKRKTFNEHIAGDQFMVRIVGCGCWVASLQNRFDSLM